jgi:hypothetical protein
MKNKIIIMSGLMIFPWSAALFAQAPDTAWTRIYGGSSYDFGTCVRQTFDGGYVISGYTRSPAWDTDVYLMKTDVDGDTLWIKNYGGSENDGGSVVRQTSDGGYIVAGYTRSFGAGDSDCYLIRTDASGDTVWTRTFGGDSTEFAYSVEKTSDGGYIVAGQTYLFGPGEFDALVIKTDSNGDTVWTRTFGGMAGEIDAAHWAHETSDGGFIIVAKKGAFGPDPADIWLIKTDENGDSLWTKTHGGEFFDIGNAIQQTSDGGYFIPGYTYSFETDSYDVFFLRTDSEGEILWTRSHGGFEDDIGQSGQQTFDGGYIIAGYTWSFGQGDRDAYIVRTDSNGDTLWTKTFGGIDIDYGRSIHETYDGGYVMTGYTYSFGQGDADIFLVKINSDQTGITDDVYQEYPGAISLGQNYPNPFNASTMIKYSLPRASDVKIYIYDILGREIQTLVEHEQPAGYHQIVWDAGDYSTGVYFLRLQAGNYTVSKRLTIIK